MGKAGEKRRREKEEKGKRKEKERKGKEARPDPREPKPKGAICHSTQPWRRALTKPMDGPKTVWICVDGGQGRCAPLVDVRVGPSLILNAGSAVYPGTALHRMMNCAAYTESVVVHSTPSTPGGGENSPGCLRCQARCGLDVQAGYCFGYGLGEPGRLSVGIPMGIGH